MVSEAVHFRIMHRLLNCYEGALVSWTMVKYVAKFSFANVSDSISSKTEVFYAGYASSAVVQSITDFWAYFEPIRQSMPQNCSTDVAAVIEYVDTVFKNGTQAQINAVKSNFGLADMVHQDDVAGARTFSFFLLPALS